MTTPHAAHPCDHPPNARLTNGRPSLPTAPAQPAAIAGTGMMSRPGPASGSDSSMRQKCSWQAHLLPHGGGDWQLLPARHHSGTAGARVAARGGWGRADARCSSTPSRIWLRADQDLPTWGSREAGGSGVPRGGPRANGQKKCEPLRGGDHVHTTEPLLSQRRVLSLRPVQVTCHSRHTMRSWALRSQPTLPPERHARPHPPGHIRQPSIVYPRHRGPDEPNALLVCVHVAGRFARFRHEPLQVLEHGLALG